MRPNNSLKLTRLAGGKAVARCLPSSARMARSSPEPPGSIAQGGWTARGGSCGGPKEPSRRTKASPWQRPSGEGRTRRMSDNPTGGKGDKPC